jgi:hypothetical protein
MVGQHRNITYADIELNGTPKDQHCGVAITIRDSVNLSISQDRADCRE